MIQTWQCRLIWGNPYTAPPDGQPRIIMTVPCDGPHPIPENIMALCRPGGPYPPGSGWTIGWHRDDPRPIRRWSKEARARVRQTNLRRRIETKFPLFAEDFIAEELARRPLYFAGEYHEHFISSGESP